MQQQNQDSRSFIHYGSLEANEINKINIERQNIPNEDQNSTQNVIQFEQLMTTSSQPYQKPNYTNQLLQQLGSNVIQAQNKQVNQQIVSTSTSSVEILPLSKENQEAIQKHQEKQLEYERSKHVSKIIVPINDLEVRSSLRFIKEPTCLFGEGPADRRERLQKMMKLIYLQTGQAPQLVSTAANYQKEEDENQNAQKEEDQSFWYKGTVELKQLREQMLVHSYEMACQRTQLERVLHMDVDTMEAAEQRKERTLEIVGMFEMDMTQYSSNSSSITKGRFSPDNKLFITATGQGVCQVWAVPSCELVCELQGHFQRVNHIAFDDNHYKASSYLFNADTLNHSQSSIFATCGSDNTIRIWDCLAITNKNRSESATEMEIEQLQSPINNKNKQCNLVLNEHEHRVNHVAFLPHSNSSKIASVSHDKTMRLWDLCTSKCLLTQTGHCSAIYSQAVHPDGALLFTGDTSGFGMIWDLRNGKCAMPVLGHQGQILCSDFSPNGYHLATGSDDNTIRLHDLRQRAQFYTLTAHHKLIIDLQFHSAFLASASHDSTIKIWEAGTWRLVKAYSSPQSKISSIHFSSDLQLMTSTCMNRKWHLWKMHKAPTHINNDDDVKVKIVQ